MSAHTQFEEDLALYALGSLEKQEQATLENHLEGCTGCQSELALVRGDMALLALSALGPAPPKRAKERLLAAIAEERKLKIVPRRRSWWAPLGWVAAAAMFALVAILWWQADRLEQELARARDVVTTLTSSDALRVTLAAAQTPLSPEGKAIYVRDRGSLIFLGSNLPTLPSNKAYQLWMIPTSGAPIPAGVFTPNSDGSVVVVQPPLPAGTEAKAFAITVEPAGGSTTPTMPILMAGNTGK